MSLADLGCLEAYRERVDIRELALSDDRGLEQAYEVESAATRQARPGWVGMSVEARMLDWRADDGWSKRLFGAWEFDRLVGVGACMVADDDPETAWVFVNIYPEFQHRGIGTALAHAAEVGSEPTISRFVSRAYRATADAVEELEHRFLKPLGYALATTETVLELDLCSVVLEPAPDLTRYTVHSYVNGVPPHLVEQVGRIKGLVDAEAPHGDLQWCESSVTAEEYFNELHLWMAQGSTVVESIALDVDEKVAAWTCLVISATEARPAWTEGTLVLASHRGHGLGAAVKLASLREAKHLTKVQSVRTSSDDSNTWMRSINAMIGFTPVEHEAIFQKASAPDPEHR